MKHVLVGLVACKPPVLQRDFRLLVVEYPFDILRALFFILMAFKKRPDFLFARFQMRGRQKQRFDVLILMEKRKRAVLAASVVPF